MTLVRLRARTVGESVLATSAAEYGWSVAPRRSPTRSAMCRFCRGTSRRGSRRTASWCSRSASSYRPCLSRASARLAWSAAEKGLQRRLSRSQRSASGQRHRTISTRARRWWPMELFGATRCRTEAAASASGTLTSIAVSAWAAIASTDSGWSRTASRAAARASRSLPSASSARASAVRARVSSGPSATAARAASTASSTRPCILRHMLSRARSTASWEPWPICSRSSASASAYRPMSKSAAALERVSPATARWSTRRKKGMSSSYRRARRDPPGRIVAGAPRSDDGAHACAGGPARWPLLE